MMYFFCECAGWTVGSLCTIPEIPDRSIACIARPELKDVFNLMTDRFGGREAGLFGAPSDPLHSLTARSG